MEETFEICSPVHCDVRNTKQCLPFAPKMAIFTCDYCLRPVCASCGWMKTSNWKDICIQCLNEAQKMYYEYVKSDPNFKENPHPGMWYKVKYWFKNKKD